MAKDQSVDKAPLPSFAPSEPVVIPPSELAKAMRQGEEFARELGKRIRKMEQPLDLEYELRQAKQEIEKLQAANRELIGTMSQFRASQERFIDTLWEPAKHASSQLHRASAFVQRVEDWHDDFFNDCTPAKDMGDAANRLDLALAGIGDRPLAKVAERAREYLNWLADPEGTGEQLPKCEEGPEECHLCALQEALDEAGY